MNKEQQDKIWNELSEESKRIIIKEFEYSKIAIDSDKKNREAHIGACATLDTLFGTHNINSKPQIKTWEDVEKAEGGEIRVDSKVINPNGQAWGLGLKYHQKAEATLKLAILIDLGYGGMVSEEEWEVLNIPKYCIIYHPTCQDERLKFDDDDEIPTKKHFIAFHAPEQRKEFMSYESNKRLVEQFFLM